MSDTPRTDSALLRYTGGEFVTFPVGINLIVDADFARQLERELADEKQRCECNRQAVDLVRGVLAQVQKDRDEWKAIAGELAERASVCLDNSHWEVKFGSGDLRDSIARFNAKKG